MTIQELGSIGEFIGSLAVLASLVYVAREIRQSNRSTKLAALQTHLSSAQKFFELPAADRDLARVIRVGSSNPDSLTEDEYIQFRYWMLLGFRGMENLFVLYSAGVIDQETWDARVGGFAFMLSTPGARKIWEGASNRYRTDFQAWVASAVREGPMNGRADPLQKSR